MTFIETIKSVLGIETKKNFQPMRTGDVIATYADVAVLRRKLGFARHTPLEIGVSKWARWYRDFSSNPAPKAG